MKPFRPLASLFLAFVLVLQFGCTSTSNLKGTGEYLDDAVITTKVKASILNEPSLHSSEIHVDTFSGTVQLSGIASSQSALDFAVAITRGVPGVKAVKSHLKIK